MASTMIMSIFKVTAVASLMMVFAWVFYSYDMLKIGLSLLQFILNLVLSGWIIGVLTTSIIMRFGQQAEVLAWGMVFLFQPISCVFYPLEVLPPVLQSIAWMVPPAHIFEGMRAVLVDGSHSRHPHSMGQWLKPCSFLSSSCPGFIIRLMCAKTKACSSASGNNRLKTGYSEYMD